MIEKILCVTSALIAGIALSLIIDSERWVEGGMLVVISAVLFWATLQFDEGATS